MSSDPLETNFVYIGFFFYDLVHLVTQMILRVFDLSPTLYPTRNMPLIMQRKERTSESSADAAIMLDVPSSSAIMPLRLPSPVFKPEMEL
jgi:hypothetical protein